MSALKEDFTSRMQKCPVVAILRGVTPAEITGVCDVLADAGVELLEIPLNSPDAVTSIKLAVEHAAGRYLAGAGTVLTEKDVSDVAGVGGKFIISPNTDPAVIHATKAAGLLSIPGFFTASEAFTALANGADFLKLFPAGALGPQYIKDLKAVIKAPIMAVGGVDPKNAADFLKVCPGIGVGSALYKSGKTLEQLKADTGALLAAIR